VTDSHRWAEKAAQVDAGVGLFTLDDRGLVEVSGADRVRWLDGMLTNDVTRLSPEPSQSGCYAALLTHQGRVVADINVAVRPDAFWLEMASQAVPGVIERFDKHIIADAVTIRDLTATMEWLGLEGPNAGSILEAAAGQPLALERDRWTEIRIDGCEVVVARTGTSARVGYRLLIPLGNRERVATALRGLGADYGLVDAGPEVLEVLRIVAGIPRFGAELDESVLPAEARLERAISQTKGCYIGQEVVARMAARGKSSHHLVGLRFDRPAPPVGTAIGLDPAAGAKKIGEITSVCESPDQGHVALAFVRSAHAASGTEVYAAGQPALISNLPFDPTSPA